MPTFPTPPYLNYNTVYIFSYYGEKLERTTAAFKRRKKDVLVSTIYDDTDETDPQEALLRRNEPYHLKHRDITTPYQAFRRPQDPALQILK